MQDWYQRVAEEMVRGQSKLGYAAAKLGIDLQPNEAEQISSSREFQQVLRRCRNQFYREMVSDPTHGKDATMGKMLAAADGLMASGEYKEAIEGYLKLAKVAGWVTVDTNVNVLGNLTAKDLADIKKGIVDGQRERAATPARSSN